MEKINVADLLKDCPKGMELNCTIFDTKVTYKGIIERIPGYPIVVQTEHGLEFELTQYGQLHNFVGAKCVIYPKGKTTWEGFVPPCKFKDGDVISNDVCICIYNGNENDKYYGSYVSIGCIDFPNYFINRTENNYFTKENAHLATEEEKQKLFQAIKDNGYKWNPETKTLEELIEPKFKVGDRIQWYGTHITQPIRVVKSLEWDRYRLDNGNYIKFGDEHAYKLLKFDINTLVPFESKVLVRNSDSGFWKPAFWGIYEAEKSNEHQYRNYLTTEGFVRHCIPYNDETKHLLGTVNDCDSYYKSW